MTKLNAAVLKAIKPIKTADDKLERARQAVREVRDMALNISSIEDNLTTVKAEMQKRLTKDLPDLFFEVGVDKIGLPAEGNMPAYDAKLTPFYSANIAAGWDDERKSKAFRWLDENGHSSLIKTKITVELDRGDLEKAKQIVKALNEIEVPHVVSLSVHAMTLTNFVKEQVEKKHKTPPLELLGATVGQVVKLKERKDS